VLDPLAVSVDKMFELDQVGRTSLREGRACYSSDPSTSLRAGLFDFAQGRLARTPVAPFTFQ